MNKDGRIALHLLLVVDDQNTLSWQQLVHDVAEKCLVENLPRNVGVKNVGFRPQPRQLLQQRGACFTGRDEVVRHLVDDVIFQ